MTTRAIEILLVDDNEDDVLMTLEAFQDAQITHQVQVLYDGQEALDYLESNAAIKNATSPLLILLDVNMPRKNGFEVLQAIKADNQLRHIPVIMLTTSTREEDVVKSYANGACSFISKPSSVDELADMARQFSVYWSQIARIPGRPREG